MTNSGEKRKYVRLKANHLTRHIKFQIPGMDIYPTNNAESKDISAGGILFTSSHAYLVGDVVRMELHIPGWEKYAAQSSEEGRQESKLPVLVLAKVVRVEALGSGKFDIGVAFVGIDDGQQHALSKYITQHYLKT